MSAISAAAEDWCAVCGTRHSQRARCLTEVLATEPERHGWRHSFVTPKGHRETIGVLLAPCEQGWRARVLTHPKCLWTVPGTTSTVKFVAETPAEAERQARGFIDEHVARRCYRAVEETGPVAPVESFAPEQTRHAEGLDASRRRICELTVRIAMDDGPVIYGRVVLASERGLFVATDTSGSPGDAIRIHAELDGLSVVMNGVVRTVRTSAQAAAGRPEGLGVGLTDPPARYVSYVRGLA